jgi:cytochrome P450 family 103
MEIPMAHAANQATRLPAAGDLPVLTVHDLDADPHGVFQFWRGTHPVVRHEVGSYFVLRYADIERLAKDPRVRATEDGFPKLLGVTEGALFDIFHYGMLTANDEVHQRRRSPFSRTFAVRMIAELRPHIRRSVEELIDGFHDKGRIEFVDQFAAQIPARVISGLLGLPREDIPAFTRLVYEVTKFFGLSITPDELPGCEAAARELQDYVEKTLQDRRRTPRDDFLSKFLAAADDDGKLSPPEIIFQIVQLIIGGTDTTRVAIVVQVALLLQHRAQWKAVCRDPGLIPMAVAEAMRFEPSVAGFGRVITEDIDIGGEVVPAGQLITLSTMSAMRDESVYDRPSVFDIRRSDHPRLHPVFGAGAHRCIGEALARAELEESLAVLSARIPQLQLDEAPVFRGHTGIRRTDTMHVSWKT